LKPRSQLFALKYKLNQLRQLADRGTTAGGSKRSARETDQVSLLSTQSAHLLATGMRRSTSVQRRLCPIKLHATPMRLSRKISGSLQRILGQRRSAYNRASD